jgi:hypothetical protein
MRPRGADSKQADFPLFGAENPNPAIRFALYASRNGAQSIGLLWRDSRPAQLPERQFHAHASGKCAGKGRTNGMPWDTTSPCTASTVFDNGPKKPVKPERLDTALMAAWQSEQWSTAFRLASALARGLSGSDAEDFRTLAMVAFMRGQMANRGEK